MTSYLHRALESQEKVFIKADHTEDESAVYRQTCHCSTAAEPSRQTPGALVNLLD